MSPGSVQRVVSSLGQSTRPGQHRAVQERHLPSIGIRMSGGVLSRAAQLQAHAQIEMEPFYPALDLDTLGAGMAVRRGELPGEQGSD